MKLYDFAYAGRGENTRLMLTLSVTPFEDCRVQRHEWPDLKPAAPFGQLPFLELDSGDKIAQQAAIESYVARLTGFEPEDLLRRARGDEVRGLIDDLATLLTPSFAIADREERIAARQQLLEGSLRDLLTCMTKCVERCSGSFLGGDEISLGDISLFTCLSGLTSGYFDGFKPELLQDWPELKTFRNRVAQVEGVRNYYAADSKYKAFQPDTDA